MQLAPCLARSLARARAWAARDPWFLAAFAVLAVATIWPIFAYRWLPFQDYPQHLAMLSILDRLSDPDVPSSVYYTVDLWQTPYIAFYALGAGLTKLFGVELAGKLLLAGYVVGLGVAMTSYLNAFGRDRWAALFAFPLAFNESLFYCFVSYLLALPVVIWLLGALRRAADAPTMGRLVAIGLGATAVLYAHLQAFALYGVLALVVAVALRPALRPFLRIVAAHVPALLLATLWLLTSGAGPNPRNPASAEAGWEPTGGVLAGMSAHLLGVYHDPSLIAIDRVMVALAFAALLLLLWRRDPPGGGLRDRIPDLLAVVALALYFLAPSGWRFVHPINTRFLPVAAFLAAAMVRLPPTLRPWRRALCFAPVLAIGLYAARLHDRAFERFQDEVGPFEAVAEKIPENRRVMTLSFSMGSGVVRLAPFVHFGQYVEVLRGGVVEYGFANFPQSPVSYVQDREPPVFPPRMEWEPCWFAESFATWGRYFQYVLVREGPGDGCWRRAVRRPPDVHLAPWSLWSFESG